MKFHTGRCGPNNQGVDLSGRKLDGLQFDNVDFTGASFKGASLKNAIFAGATLKEADFTGADLTGATFPINSYRGQVKLEGANFTDAKIDGVTWTGAAFDCKTKFPKGFDPAAAEMQTKDASCAAGQLKNPGVVDYSKERLGQGYMSVCNGDYHADCIYGFLSSYVVKHVDWGYEREFVRLAKSFVEAGYPELAKVMALKFIGGIALSRHSLDPKYFATWIPVMEQVEAAEKGGTVGKPQTVKLERRQEGEAQALADQSRQAAEAGDYKQAVSYADQIGDAAYNRDVLKWPADGGPIRPTSTESFYHYDREFTAALGAVALERRRQNKDIDAITRYIRDIEGRKPQNRDGSRDRDTLGVLDILAGVETPAAAPEKSYSRRSEPARYAAAYAAAGKPDKAWEIYAEAAGMDTRMGVSALEAIADYYAAHPDDKGRQKVLDELVKLGLESWPADGAKARGGFESDVYGTFFGIAAEMKAEKLVRDILSRTEKYENEGLRARVRLFAATALAEMGKGAEALALFEKSRQAFTELPPEAQGGRRGMPKYMIMLGAVNSATVMKQPPSFIQDQDIGKFILRLAASGAPLEDKKKALAAGRELLSAGKAGSALFRAQLAVATAAVLKDKESGQRMKDAQYGVPAAAFAGLLHDAGFHTAEKQLIDVAWASQGAPHSVGLDRLGPRGGFARMRNGMQLAALAGMLAKDGHFDAAERAAMTVVDPSSIQRLGGTDYVAYFMRQKALHDTAALAAAKGKADVAADIAAAKMNYAPYQSGVYFALANASFDAKKTADAKAYYDKGYALAPNFGDAMGAPLVDPDGLALDILVTRAAAEKKLGLADNLARTQAFAQQAAAVAEMDVQRGKTSVAVERIARIIAGTKATKQQDIDDFIAQLKIRDDLNSTDVVADMAEKFLAAGEPEKARAVALYGFRNIDNYPQASGKTTVLLPYASLIARTEPKMGRESVEKIKAILMQVHGNSPGSKITPEDEKRDLIGEGIKAYEELKRRNAMDAAPKDDGSDRLTKLKKDGSIVYNGGGWLMQQWLAGAAQKLKPGDPAGAAAVIAAKTPDTNNHFGGLDRNYGVITREITLPSQAYGGPINGRYIVPADVPRPKGPRHEMTIFYMKDFTCEGNFEPFCKY
jgi:tetratricopeptide (TPR) repeat protein